MKFTLTLNLVSLLISALAEDKTNTELLRANPDGREARIFGGSEVVPHYHPYIVAVITDLNGHSTLCHGSIISDSLVVTDAMCLYRTSSAEVIAGAHDLTRFEPSQQRQTLYPSRYYLHELFDTSPVEYNIALLRLNNILILNAYVRTILLPFGMQNETFAGEVATVAGKFVIIRLSPKHLNFQNN